MIPYFQTPSVTLYNANCLDGLSALADNSVQTCVTSPPYFGLRNYQHPEQIGLEKTPDEYIAKLMEVFKQVHRVLQNDGTLFLNLGDSYAGSNAQQGGDGSSSKLGPSATDSKWTRTQQAMRISDKGQIKKGDGLKHKDLIGAPWRAALALQGFAVVPFRSFSTWANELSAAREAQDWSAVEIIERRLRAMDLLSALNAQGWYLRQDIIWAKGCSGAYTGGSVMPESVTDRCTKAHEYIFLLTKSARYYYDCMAVKEKLQSNGFGGLFYKSTSKRKGTGLESSINFIPNETRNRRSVWTVNTPKYSGAHFATFPPELITPCISAGAPPGCTVLDPFAGSGTTLMVAQNLGRRAVGFELNPDYCKLVVERCQQMTIFDLAPSSAVKKTAPTQEKDTIPAPLLADLV